jgi:hypothetical protein
MTLRRSDTKSTALTAVLALSITALSSCAAKPSFRENPARGPGYRIVKSSDAQHFTITARLPRSTAFRYRHNYVLRAAGETCQARGFAFFEVPNWSDDAVEGQLETHHEAHCLANDKHRDVGKPVEGNAELLKELRVQIRDAAD